MCIYEWVLLFVCFSIFMLFQHICSWFLFFLIPLCCFFLDFTEILSSNFGSFGRRPSWCITFGSWEFIGRISLSKAGYSVWIARLRVSKTGNSIQFTATKLRICLWKTEKSSRLSWTEASHHTSTNNTTAIANGKKTTKLNWLNVNCQRFV